MMNSMKMKMLMILIINSEGSNNFNSFYGINEEEKETTKLKEIII